MLPTPPYFNTFDILHLIFRKMVKQGSVCGGKVSKFGLEIQYQKGGFDMVFILRNVAA